MTALRLALVAPVLLPAVDTAWGQELCPTETEKELTRLINLERAGYGLPPVRLENRLIEAARGHSDDMATNDFMSHDGSDGSTPADRISAAGYPYFTAGETVAAGYTTPAAVVEGWMNSPGHRAILLGNYEDIGVGYAYNAAAYYQRYWTANFGIASDGGQPASLDCDVTTVYEDAEDTSTDGWDIYDNNPAGASVSNIYDGAHQSQVIELAGAGKDNGYRLRNNDGSKWRNADQLIIEWSMTLSEYYGVYIDVETTVGHRYMYYTPIDWDQLGASEYVHHGLGTHTFDGQWRTFVRDLQVDLDEAQPGAIILEVNGFWIRGSGRVDDIKLHSVMPSLIYEDAEDGTTQGWHVYDKNPAGAVIGNAYDATRDSQVIELTGAGEQNGYRLWKENGTRWHNNDLFVIEWSMSFSEPYTVYIDVETTAGHRYLYYTPINWNKLGAEEYVHHGLGSHTMDGGWKTFARDLQADLQEAQPAADIIEVNGFLVRGSGSVDDIKLHSKMPHAVYEDGEDGTTLGWGVYDDSPTGAIFVNLYDATRQSRVIELQGTGQDNGFRLRNEAGSKWRNQDQFIIEWSMAYSGPVTIYVDVETPAGHRYLYYSAVDTDYLGNFEYVHHGLGSGVIDGQWRTFARDLQSDLADAQPGVDIIEVNGVFIRGSGRLDDVSLRDK